MVANNWQKLVLLLAFAEICHYTVIMLLHTCTCTYMTACMAVNLLIVLGLHSLLLLHHLLHKLLLLALEPSSPRTIELLTIQGKLRE